MNIHTSMWLRGVRGGERECTVGHLINIHSRVLLFHLPGTSFPSASPTLSFSLSLSPFSSCTVYPLVRKRDRVRGLQASSADAKIWRLRKGRFAEFQREGGGLKSDGAKRSFTC